MEFSHSLIGSVALKSAIDTNPLLVAPHTPLLEVMAQMSQVKGHVCDLQNDGLRANRSGQNDLELGTPEHHQSPTSASNAAPNSPSSMPSRQTSCVLIVDQDTTIGLSQQQVIGIFTERDIVKLVSKGVDLEPLTIEQVMVSPVISLAESEFKDIFAPLFLFRRYKIRHLLLVDDCDRPIGIVSPESIRTILRPANLLKLRRVSDIMAQNVVCSHYQDSVLHATQLMTKHRVSCVVITEQDVDRGALPVGIVTERDIVQFRTLELDFAIPVGTVMSSPLSLLEPDDSLWTAHQEMQRLRVRRLVVSWNWGKGLGIVTQTSLLRAFDPLEMYSVLETLQTTIQQLQSEKRLSAQFANSPTLDVEPKPQTPPTLSRFSNGSNEANEANGLNETSLGDVCRCVEQLSQHLKRMETTLAAASRVEGDGTTPLPEEDHLKHPVLQANLAQALNAIQHLEQLLQPTQEATPMPVSRA